jgi:hypothetical protein
MQMNEMNQLRKERIEDLLDSRLAEDATNSVDSYYQSRDISNLTQALLNMTRIIKEDD